VLLAQILTRTKRKFKFLVIGDPGLGKSAMLRKSIELVPNSRYESAENSSGKSLTAIVEKGLRRIGNCVSQIHIFCYRSKIILIFK
jgi:DNA replicative helicase MCM subunit Mcm2 (Cdc46/Mcm family)